MDLWERRGLWSFLKRQKEERSITDLRWSFFVRSKNKEIASLEFQYIAPWAEATVLLWDTVCIC